MWLCQKVPLSRTEYFYYLYVTYPMYFLVMFGGLQATRHNQAACDITFAGMKRQDVAGDPLRVISWRK
jgi:hypothetical protein